MTPLDDFEPGSLAFERERLRDRRGVRLRSFSILGTLFATALMLAHMLKIGL